MPGDHGAKPTVQIASVEESTKRRLREAAQRLPDPEGCTSARKSSLKGACACAGRGYFGSAQSNEMGIGCFVKRGITDWTHASPHAPLSASAICSPDDEQPWAC